MSSLSLSRTVCSLLFLFDDLLELPGISITADLLFHDAAFSDELIEQGLDVLY